jgi:hypothetical protein
MKKKRLAVLVGVVAAVLVAATITVVIRDRDGSDFVQVLRRSRPTLENSTSQTSAPSTSMSSTSTTVPTPETMGSQDTPETAPTTAASPWQVSATSGLTNLAPVTITGTGIPSESYDVGQCPANEAPSLDACVLNHVVTVTDGTLTSTVQAFWWLKNGRVDCGSAPGACVVGVMNARTAETVASFPISFDTARRPTISVTPASSLIDGQTMVIRADNIGAGSVNIGECILAGYMSCTDVDLPSNPDGSYTASLTVVRMFEWLSRGGPASGICEVDYDCVVRVSVTPPGLPSYPILIDPDQPITLHFAPAPLPTTTTIVWPPQ